MNVCRKICVVFSNFNNKLIRGRTFGKENIANKKFGKTFYRSTKRSKVPTIRLNQNRSNT